MENYLFNLSFVHKLWCCWGVSSSFSILTTAKRPPLCRLFLPRTACRRDTPLTSPTRTKLAENLWNTFEQLCATWISVEPRSLLVTCHDPSTFRKIDSKNFTTHIQRSVQAWSIGSTVSPIDHACTLL